MIRRSWLLAGCLAAAFAAQAQPAPAGTTAADPERQLQAIRDALVEKTLAAPVRVQSFGWIDTEGRLHESTQFTSDTRVRGVRVQAYVEDPAAPVRVQVDTTVLPSGVGPTAEADPQRCLASPRRWRQALHVEAVSHSPATAALLPQLEQAFLEAARDSRRWVAQQRPYQPQDAYEQAVYGRDVDRTEWLARLEVVRSSNGLEARIAVAPLLQPAQARRVQVPLPYVAAPGDLSMFPTLDPRAVHAVMTEAMRALERQSACDPMWYSVAGSGERLHLREGLAHGLQPGDRLLLVDRQHLSGRLLEPGVARALALVQVGVPSSRGTPLRWLAGPRPTQVGDWVALPL